MTDSLRLAADTDVPAIRQLVNKAYAELAAMGLNYTGTYQDEETTRDRMRDADVFLVHEDGVLVASINLRVDTDQSDGTKALYINQLAVHPSKRGLGLGSRLLDRAEARARELGLGRLRLDTAVPATHLVALYERRGYRKIHEVQWDGKTYRSLIMEKRL